MTDSAALEKAMLIPLKNNTAQMDQKCVVHFNPETLKISRTVSVKADTGSKNSSNQAAQQTANGSATLAIDLVFDTTDVFESKQDAADVQLVTGRIVQNFVAPPRPEGMPDNTPVPANPCLFVWGTFQFAGMVESFNETLEFFSSTGVPLRSVLSLSIKESRYKVKNPNAGRAATLQPLPAQSPIASALGAAGLDPTDWRKTALAAGLESPRFSAVGGVDVSAGIQVGAAASIGGGAGFSAGASADLGSAVPGAFSASGLAAGGFG